MRSLLFVPGDSERKLEKSLGTDADALILDLEDSVSAEHKTRARNLTRDFLQSTDRASAPRLYVRINGLATPFWQQDLATLGAARPDGFMIPKANGGDDVRQIAAAVGEIEPATHGERPIGLIVLATETPLSLLRMESYVGASERLEALTWGAEDLSAEIGASANRNKDGAFKSPYRLARDLCLITAAAADVPAIDTVFTNFRDEAGLVREAEEAAQDGFSGKLAIHPSQVGPINAAFTPDAETIARAEAILAAFAEAERQGSGGVASLDGQMLDRPHRLQAQRLLARAKPANA